MKCLLILLFVTGISVCQNLKPEEGYINVKGGRIWYRVVGEKKGTPLLLIHGGPGGSCCSGIPVYSSLSNERPVIFYDQLGSGRSDWTIDTTLLQLERFVDEITAIRKQLGLKEVHILGTSWGGAVLAEYLISQNPTGIRSVIFRSPFLSTPVWIRDAKILLSQLPGNLQDTIKKYESLKNYTAPSYLAATDSFYSRFNSRKWDPKTVYPGCEGIRTSNYSIYNYMWGPTEFTATGTLKNFDRTPDLHKITQPTLFLAGEYDEARPETMYMFSKLIKNSRVSIIKNAAHSCIIDQPEETIKEIRNFLHSAESR